ncbi:MAG: Asp-tRNA(Asn)/Glu-tRNA(Gln) amidotransferase subunit GatC [Parcubacteria group bacterium]|nr:Asp-tRNA(Asn)/Glu-tRNA(Gln) amidotransferase subunit GatC [Parcubacteria group bacterium]
MDFSEIDYLLNLARLDISSEEKEKIAHDLAKILDYVNQLQQVNTEGLEPMDGGTFLENIWRADEINPQKVNLKQEGYFTVPPIFE